MIERLLRWVLGDELWGPTMVVLGISFLFTLISTVIYRTEKGLWWWEAEKK